MRSISCNGTVKTVGVPSWEAAKVGYTYTTSETWPSHGRPNGTTCRRPWQVLLGAKRVGWRPTRRGRWPLAVLVDEFRFNSQGDFGRSNSNRLGCTNSLLSYTRSSFVCGTVRVTVVMSHPMAIGKSPQSVARGASRNPDSVGRRHPPWKHWTPLLFLPPIFDLPSPGAPQSHVVKDRFQTGALYTAFTPIARLTRPHPGASQVSS